MAYTSVHAAEKRNNLLAVSPTQILKKMLTFGGGGDPPLNTALYIVTD